MVNCVDSDYPKLDIVGPVNTWSPIFSKIVDSSLWSEPDFVVKVFLTLLAKKDADQVARLTAYAIGKLCWPKDDEAEKRVLEALSILASPDTKRVEPQPHEGRRIQKVEGGWYLLNGRFYEEMMRRQNRRDYQKDKQAEYRKRKKDQPLKGESEYMDALRDGATREQLDKIVIQSLPKYEGET